MYQLELESSALPDLHFYYDIVLGLYCQEYCAVPNHDSLVAKNLYSSKHPPEKNQLLTPSHNLLLIVIPIYKL